jgi:hypothetical protein
MISHLDCEYNVRWALFKGQRWDSTGWIGFHDKESKISEVIASHGDTLAFIQVVCRQLPTETHIVRDHEGTWVRR